MNERLDYVECLLDEDVSKKVKFDKQGVLTSYKRLKSVRDYKFSNKLKSLVHLFRATLPMIKNATDDYNLIQICENPVKITVVEGDHINILEGIQLVDHIKDDF